jgi:hypothetical protein
MTASDLTICPFCGWIGANDVYDSHGGFEYDDKGYQVYQHCNLCGWSHFGDDQEENGEIDLEPNTHEEKIAIKIVAMYKKLDKETERIVSEFIDEEMEERRGIEYEEFLQHIIKYTFGGVS